MLNQFYLLSEAAHATPQQQRCLLTQNRPQHPLLLRRNKTISMAAARHGATHCWLHRCSLTAAWECRRKDCEINQSLTPQVIASHEKLNLRRHATRRLKETSEPNHKNDLLRDFRHATCIRRAFLAYVHENVTSKCTS